MAMPKQQGRHDLAVDWKEILSQACKLKHKQRRKYIKKIKRSCERRKLAAASSLQADISYLSSSSDGEAEKPLTHFGEVVSKLRESRKNVFPLNNPDLLVHDCASSSNTVSTASNQLQQNVIISSDNAELLFSNGENDQKKNNSEGSNTEINTLHHEADVNQSPTMHDKVSSNGEKQEEATQDSTYNDDPVDTVKDAEVAKLLQDLDEEVKEWHNPFLPETAEDLQTRVESNPSWSSSIISSEVSKTPDHPSVSAVTKPICQFYEKVGSCRFGDKCSRYHNQVSTSTTVLLHGMFTTFAYDITQRALNSHHGDANDLSLEYSDADLYEEFIQFSDDVLPELENYGEVKQFKVCCNNSHHLIGNVYVQYKNEKQARHAAEQLSGRFFGGKRLHAQFVSIKSWKNAICGLHYNNRNCPRGNQCNFLHVFKDPSRRFYQVDTESQRESSFRDRNLSSRHSHRSERRTEYSTRGRSPRSRSHRHRSSSYDSDSKKRRRHKKSFKKHKDKKESNKKHHKHKKQKKEKR